MAKQNFTHHLSHYWGILLSEPCVFPTIFGNVAIENLGAVYGAYRFFQGFGEGSEDTLQAISAYLFEHSDELPLDIYPAENSNENQGYFIHIPAADPILAKPIPVYLLESYFSDVSDLGVIAFISIVASHANDQKTMSTIQQHLASHS